MNKFFITAGTVSLGSVAAEARESLFQRFFKNLRFHKTARPKAEPTVAVDSQVIDERGWEPDKPHSPIHYLTAMHPQVIAVSLFSRKSR